MESWWRFIRKRESSCMQRSTGRRQVRFNIMGLRCAEMCHLPQAGQQGVDGRGICTLQVSSHSARLTVVGKREC